jgi:Kef-type K+ transport system membrane component KefB
VRKNLLFYVFLLLAFGGSTYGILTIGSRLEPQGTALQAPASPEVTAPAKAQALAKEIGGGFLDHLRQPLSLLLLQVIVIVLAAKGMGALMLRIGQPPVIGEMIAGILLGPSLLGFLAPQAQTFLFPDSSLGGLKLLSQIGVILFLFVVGMELDLQQLRNQAHAAVLVSHASIVVPFFLGTVAALALYRTLAPAGLPFTPFGLFIGISMSITAFPVLARILEERRMSRSPLGSTALACAAVDDVTAWCLLAAVVALVNANGLGGAMLTIVLTVLFIGTMLFGVRPLMSRLVAGRFESPGRSTVLLSGVVAFVFASALLTEVIGIHALFGAFLAGVCIPRDSALRELLRERLETLSSVLLLPLFFAFTGLRTQVGLLDDWQSWLACFGIIAVAITGKLGGSLIAARWTGMGWGDSFALGALLNTRGLVELIVLNLGYDLGILSPRIFAMLVLMALITTCMTGPLLSFVGWARRRHAGEAVGAEAGA